MYAQVKLTKNGTNHWSWGTPTKAAFVTGTPTTGLPTHPELLSADLGNGNKAILFINRITSLTGNKPIFYTLNEGSTWKELVSTPAFNFTDTNDTYYPESLQINDGPNGSLKSVVVYGHYGLDYQAAYPSPKASYIVQHKFTLVPAIP
jgi:hypothetical protein